MAPRIRSDNLAIGMLAGRSTADQQQPAPHFFAAHRVGNRQTHVAGVHELHTVVQRHVEHPRIEPDRQRERGRQPKDRPLQPGCPDHLLALHLVVRVILGRTDDVVDRPGWGLVLCAAVDVQR